MPRARPRSSCGRWASTSTTPHRRHRSARRARESVRRVRTRVSDAGSARRPQSRDEEAHNFKDEFVSTEHLLLAIADTPGQMRSQGSAPRKTGADKEKMLAALATVRGSQRITDQDPKASIRRWSATAAISPRWRSRTRSIRSSAATKRSGASSKCSRGARRTIRCSSASRASAKPRSSKGSRIASCAATCPRV